MEASVEEATTVQCDLCGSELVGHRCPQKALASARGNLRSHRLRQHSDETFRCDTCSHSSRNLANMATHVKKIHGLAAHRDIWRAARLAEEATEKPRLSCDSCGFRPDMSQGAPYRALLLQIARHWRANHFLRYRPSQRSRPQLPSKEVCVCDLCGSRITHGTLRVHLASRHPSLRMRHAAWETRKCRSSCDACGYSAQSIVVLRTHMSRCVAQSEAVRRLFCPKLPQGERAQRRVTCDDCDTPMNTGKHMALYHGGSYVPQPKTCDHCGKVAPDGRVAQHLAMAHGFAGRDKRKRLRNSCSHTCDLCSLQLGGRALLRHLASVHDQFAEEELSRRFSVGYRIICDWCRKPFPSRQHLTRHLRKCAYFPHRRRFTEACPEERAAVSLRRRCDDCGLVPFNLHLHVRMHHLGIKQQPVLYFCDDCGAGGLPRKTFLEHNTLCSMT